MKKGDVGMAKHFSIQGSLHRELPEVRLVEKLSICGWNCVCQPYIERATALSDKSQEMPVFRGCQKWDLRWN